MRTAVLLLMLACSRGDDPASPPPAAPPAPPPAKPAPVDAAVIDAAARADLPPLDLAEVDAKNMTQSIDKNTAGYKQHAAKHYPEAAAAYTEAIKLDPGNLLARYNLASVYSSTNEDDKALALLAQLERSDCRACTGILVHAKTDGEWKHLAKDPRFTAIVDGATADKVDLKKVSQMVIDAVTKGGKLDGLRPYVHPRGPIKVAMLFYGPPEQAPPPDLLYGWTQFAAWAKPIKRLTDAGELNCDGTCCKAGPHGDSSFVVGRVCFGGVGGVLFVTEIGLDPGPL
jgi:hypothetical protein